MESFPVAYFGSIAYFRKLIHADKPVFEVCEHFIKQTDRSRCTILGANGIQFLSVPVIKPFGSKTPISEVRISDDKKWRKEHWRSIESAYASAPYFEAYDREIHSMIEFETVSLVELDLHITVEVLRLFELPLVPQRSTVYKTAGYMEDYRNDKSFEEASMRPYIQVFGNQFIPNLSILDLLFCEGPMARNYLVK